MRAGLLRIWTFAEHCAFKAICLNVVQRISQDLNKSMGTYQDWNLGLVESA